MLNLIPLNTKVGHSMYNKTQLLLGLWLLLVLASTSVQANTNKALDFGWQGHVETNRSISSLLNGDRTISIWFMAQYPGAYSGSFVATDSSNVAGKFSFGQGRFSWSNKVCGISRNDR